MTHGAACDLTDGDPRRLYSMRNDELRGQASDSQTGIFKAAARAPLSKVPFDGLRFLHSRESGGTAYAPDLGTYVGWRESN